MVRENIKKILNQALISLGYAKFVQDLNIDHPDNKEHGDFSTNAAMQLAGLMKKNPMELAELIKVEIEKQSAGRDIFSRADVVNPGFINFILSPKYLAESLNVILRQADKYGEINIGGNEKVLLEFISANPTGPLTIANGRGGFGGDVLANVMAKAGYSVSREYYINDAGFQVKLLGKSIQAAANMIAHSEELYQGEYIKELAEQYPAKISKDFFSTGRKFARIILENEIKPAVNKMGINFDNWFSEYDLHQAGEIDKTLEFLSKKELTYEKDGAIWLKTSKFGDSKDRVIRKSFAKGGEPTYVLPDIAYHKNKFERGYKKLIDIMGADHHGYVPRLKIGVKSIGFGDLEVILTQLVKLCKGGKVLKMTKRKGNFEIMSDLIDEVGLDAVRWFFIMRDWNSHLIFDMDLAKEKSEKNPVYYVQYAHARITNILKNAGAKIGEIKAGEHTYRDEHELNLIRELIKFPEIIEDIALRYEVHHLPYYAMDLAKTFHIFYNKCRVISDDKKLTESRIALSGATKIVLQNILQIIGVQAPEKM